MIKVVLFLCMSLISSLSSAEHINVVGAEFPPYYTQSTPSHGISGEVIQRILKKHGYKPYFKVRPFARALTESESGKADIIAALYHTPQRDQHFLFTNSLISANVMLFKLASNTTTYTGIENLTNSRIGMIRRSSTKLDLINNPNLEVIPINNYIQGLDLLSAKRIDYLVGNQLVLKYLLKQQPHPHTSELYIPIEPPLSVENTYIATSKKSPMMTELSEILNQGIETMKMNGELNAIINKHINL